MRLNLRSKLILFAVVLAVLPLLVAGERLTRIVRDELKSAANDALVTAARRISTEIDSTYRYNWLAPLTLIRNAVDDDRLGIEEKISLLTLGIAELRDIVALQITIEGTQAPLVVSQQRFYQRLQEAGVDPAAVLRLPGQKVAEYRARNVDRFITHIPETDDWVATLILPMEDAAPGRTATLSAHINLRRIRDSIENDPLNQTGEIAAVNRQGLRVFQPTLTDLSERSITARAIELLESQSRAITVEPYRRPDGEAFLGAIAFPEACDCAILVEMSERNAYLAVGKMIRTLLVWVTLGFIVATAGAIFFSLRMSRPILAIAAAATEVAKGNFKTRVTDVHSRDEIGQLARRINHMIEDLSERFQLMKFVSAGTLDAIQHAHGESISLGGESRRVTALFADIRGYTAFAEDKDPEVVVDTLNRYFQSLADIVTKHQGDIDKFVGDQIMAVFQGPDMARNAVACALEFQQAMEVLGAEYPEADLEIGVGIHLGEVVMGAMGSKQRMDYTVLGDNVNLAARLCSHARGRQNLISESVYDEVRGVTGFTFIALEPVRVKGKSQPIPVYAAEASAEFTVPDPSGGKGDA